MSDEYENSVVGDRSDTPAGQCLVRIAPSQEDHSENPLDEVIVDGIRSLQINGEPDFLTGLIDIYCNSSAALMATTKTLVENGRTPELRQIVHALKGSSANLGARPFARLCDRLERLSQAGDLTGIREVLPEFEREYSRLCQALQALRKPDTSG